MLFFFRFVFKFAYFFDSLLFLCNYVRNCLVFYSVEYFFFVKLLFFCLSPFLNSHVSFFVSVALLLSNCGVCFFATCRIFWRDDSVVLLSKRLWCLLERSSEKYTRRVCTKSRKRTCKCILYVRSMVRGEWYSWRIHSHTCHIIIRPCLRCRSGKYYVH